MLFTIILFYVQFIQTASFKHHQAGPLLLYGQDSCLGQHFRDPQELSFDILLKGRMFYKKRTHLPSPSSTAKRSVQLFITKDKDAQGTIKPSSMAAPLRGT